MNIKNSIFQLSKQLDSQIIAIKALILYLELNKIKILLKCLLILYANRSLNERPKNCDYDVNFLTFRSKYLFYFYFYLTFSL